MSGEQFWMYLKSINKNFEAFYPFARMLFHTFIKFLLFKLTHLLSLLLFSVFENERKYLKTENYEEVNIHICIG